ncbi:hypothetical protein K1720_08440 [Thermococcus argininiproducens]|uniref:Uncharacterized protein n=1 Tax=Thermococcus argininiproducens TaxID=2866384 RepID=A0A9E7SCK8_9EURY|nr:hypothetical protein [Thermococcus argininiproducens]USG99531.1 hypothetical protein K1720_08440 [Thermococcus argininiproducens]
MKRLFGVVLILLVIALSASTYSLHQYRKEREKILNRIYTDFEVNRWELEGVGGTLEYLLNQNASDEVISLYLIKYRDNAMVTGKVFSILYFQTDEDKFIEISTAIDNLARFLNTLANRPPKDRRTLLMENIQTLKEFDRLFKKLTKYQNFEDIPGELAKELLNASEKLKY